MQPAHPISPAIRLRKLEPDDLPLLYAWENDSDAWLDSDTHNPLSQEDLRAYILRTTGDIYQDGQLRLMVCLGQQQDTSNDEEGVPVGCVDLYDVDIRNRKAAVAIYIAPDYRGQGVAAQALLQLKSYVSHILCFRILYAYVREANRTSIRMFQSAGFQLVATLPNWVNEGDVCVLQTAL